MTATAVINAYAEDNSSSRRRGLHGDEPRVHRHVVHLSIAEHSEQFSIHLRTFRALHPHYVLIHIAGIGHRLALQPQTDENKARIDTMEEPFGNEAIAIDQNQGHAQRQEQK